MDVIHKAKRRRFWIKNSVMNVNNFVKTGDFFVALMAIFNGIYQMEFRDVSNQRQFHNDCLRGDALEWYILRRKHLKCP